MNKKMAGLALGALILLFSCGNNQKAVNLGQSYDLEASATGVPCGDPVDFLNGIPVRSNGVHNGNGAKSCGSGTSYGGLKWQCVEFVRRYLAEATGENAMLPLLSYNGNNSAKWFLEAVEGKDLTDTFETIHFNNATPLDIKMGDVLVFGDTSNASQWGHVGIAGEIGTNTIQFLSQNTPNSRYTIYPQGGQATWDGMPLRGVIRYKQAANYPKFFGSNELQSSDVLENGPSVPNNPSSPIPLPPAPEPEPKTDPVADPIILPAPPPNHVCDKYPAKAPSEGTYVRLHGDAEDSNENAIHFAEILVKSVSSNQMITGEWKYADPALGNNVSYPGNWQSVVFSARCIDNLNI